MIGTGGRIIFSLSKYGDVIYGYPLVLLVFFTMLVLALMLARKQDVNVNGS